jgi:small nuclear ribonucleoprotein (snRNP)-like protein
VQEEKGVKANLAGFLDRVVTVTSKDGRKFRGKLVGYDDYMNLLLENARDEHEGLHKLLILKGGNVSDISL